MHEQYAYVGSWGFSDYASGSKQRFCPPPDKAGVAVLDTRDPSKPRVVSKLQNPAGTSVEDVVVYTAPYGPRAGRDIAVAGIQVCGGDAHGHGLLPRPAGLRRDEPGEARSSSRC